MLIFRIILKVLTAVCGLALLLTAWSGTIDPRTLPFAAVLAMTVPAVIAVNIVVLVLDLIWCRFAAIFAVACLAVAFPAVSENFPFHPGSHKLDPADRGRSWTLLTYNVFDFYADNGEYPGDQNATIHYIIETDADVVALQEAEFLSPFKPYHITKEQIDTLKQLYPHILLDGTSMCLLSKFPVKRLQAGFGKGKGSGDCAGYELNIRGHKVMLMNVHMQSIGLTDEDKKLFREITSVKKQGDAPRPTVNDVRTQLVSKLGQAAMLRAGQADLLVSDIDRYAGTDGDVVVCGDFNDVPGCWTLRRLAKCGLREVYPEVGLGYMRTYHRNRFWFRIDHVLYRGNLCPVSMTRGDLKYSDHFPLLTTFVFDK